MNRKSGSCLRAALSFCDKKKKNAEEIGALAEELECNCFAFASRQICDNRCSAFDRENLKFTGANHLGELRHHFQGFLCRVDVYKRQLLCNYIGRIQNFL